MSTSSSIAFNVSIEGTLNVGEELIDSLADRVLSLENSRRSLLPIQEDKITSMVRYSLFKITNSCENCSLYKFIEEYIIVLAKTMGRVLRKVLGPKYIEVNYHKQVNEYVEYIKKILLDGTEEINSPSFWIVTIKMINSKFQQLSAIYSKDPSPNIDKNDLRHKIVLATVIMENNYLNILCVEHDMCLTKNKFTSAFLAVLAEVTKAPSKKVKSILNSFYRALFDTRLYTHMNEDFAHKVQVQLYEFVENPSRRILLDLQKIVEEHVNKTSVTEKTPRHVDLIHAILSDLDIIYVVQSSVHFTEFLESFYVFLKNDVKLNMPKILLEIQKVISALAGEFFNKLYNQVRVLLEILLSKVPSDIPKYEYAKPVASYEHFT